MKINVQKSKITLPGFSGSRAQPGNFKISLPMLFSSPSLVLFMNTFDLETRFTRMFPWSSIFSFTPYTYDRQFVMKEIG